MKTYTAKKSELKPEWHLLDAENQVLGKLSTQIVTILMGKNKVTYSPNLNCDEQVVVINSSKVVLTGNKEMGKIYQSHSGMVGRLKTKTAEQVRKVNPNKMIFNAVRGMLPKNKLRKRRLANLHIYAGSENPHSAQVK